MPQPEHVCDACDKPTRDYVTGYLAPGTTFCKPCHEYMENDVFAYKPERDGPPPEKLAQDSKFWDKYKEMLADG